MLTDDRNDPSKKLMQYRSDRSTEWYLTFMCAFNFRSVVSFFFFSLASVSHTYIPCRHRYDIYVCIGTRRERERERKKNLLVERNNLICTYKSGKKKLTVLLFSLEIKKKKERNKQWS